MIEKHKKRVEIENKESVTILLFCVTFVFNLIIFNQFDVILQNQNEFGIALGDVFWLFALIFAFLTLLMFFVLKFLREKFYVLYKIALSLAFGFLLASYLQVLFLNGDSLNILDGSQPFNFTTLSIIFNTIIYLLLIGAPVACAFIFKNKTKLINKTVLCASIIILGMQSFGIVAAYATSSKSSVSNRGYYFSIDDYLKVSKEDNIIIFQMDRLGTYNSLYTFEKFPESQDIFDGFTFYKNNLSEFNQTFPSVPQMLTNKAFNETQSPIEYFNKAWEDVELYDLLHENGYTVNGLFDNYSTYYNIEDLIPFFDNIKQAQSYTVNEFDVLKKTSKISLMRNMPYLLKEKFDSRDYSNFQNIFLNYSSNFGYYPKSASAQTDLFFNNYLNQNRLENNSTKKVFSYVILNSSHSPYFYDNNLNTISARYDTDALLDQTYGSLKILNNYLEQLKSLVDDDGISLFDKSTIIVLGDHGDPNTFDTTHDIGINQNVFASLFIKQKNADSSQNLIIDEDAQMSNGFFYSTILELIGESDKKPNKSYFDVINENSDQERYYYKTIWDGFDGNFQSKTKFVEKYKIIGDAFLSSNWHLIE